MILGICRRLRPCGRWPCNGSTPWWWRRGPYRGMVSCWSEMLNLSSGNRTPGKAPAVLTRRVSAVFCVLAIREGFVAGASRLDVGIAAERCRRLEPGISGRPCSVPVLRVEVTWTVLAALALTWANGIVRGPGHGGSAPVRPRQSTARDEEHRRSTVIRAPGDSQLVSHTRRSTLCAGRTQ
jgi:hypothetical protein